MDCRAQKLSLGLFIFALVLGAGLVFREEIRDVFFRSSRLGMHCQEHAAMCQKGEAQSCLRALQNLEVVDQNLTSWRMHFVGSAFVAWMVLAVAIACRLPLCPTTLLMITAFLAASMAFRHQNSWNSAHVAKHSREARRNCLQQLSDVIMHGGRGPPIVTNDWP